MKKLLLLLFFLPYFANGQTITTIAGNGILSDTGFGGPAILSETGQPRGVGVDDSGNVYIACWSPDSYVFKVNTSGIISVFAGNGIIGYGGDGGAATAAELSNPTTVAFDGLGNVYIPDPFNRRIRKVSPSGVITTFAGNGTYGNSGDGGAAVDAELGYPNGIAFDASGNAYITDEDFSCVRKVNTLGIISLFAGNYTPGFSGDDGPAAVAQLDAPARVTVDSPGNVYVADWGNERIRKINTTGIITTIAGGGMSGLGDGGPATAADIGAVVGIYVSPGGDLYMADMFSRVRLVNSSGIISTVAGNSSPGYSGDGGPATLAELHYPIGVAMDRCQNLYIADFYNNRVRKVTYNPTPAITISATPSDTVCAATPVTFYATVTADSVITYQWFVNSTMVSAATSNTYTYVPLNGDAVRCVISGKAQCSGFMEMISSNTLRIVVYPTAAPTIHITASPGDSICSGTPVTCTAVVTGGGISPAYQWVVNGSYAGTGDSAYSYIPAGGDSIRCIVTSSNFCASPMVAGSNTINITDVLVSSTLPVTISGDSVVCSGAAIILTDAVSGGFWTSSNTTVATATAPGGTITGVSAGTAIINYTFGAGCTVTYTITVDPAPLAITGSMYLCMGEITVLHDATTGGTWSSESPAVATIHTTRGSITGIGTGTSNISYTLPTGCMATATVTINPLPGAITGATEVCLGGTTTIRESPGGGSWSSASPTVAAIDAVTGVVAAISAGIAVINYTIETTGCSASIIITAEPLPEIYSVTGGGSYCAGGTGEPVGLSGSASDIRYQLFNGASATGSPLTGTGSALDFGLQTLIGTYTAVATNLVTGCTQNMADSAVITIIPIDTTGRSQDTAICYYSDAQVITLTAPASTGIWFSGSISATDTISAPGAYWFIYPDSIGCAFTADTFQVAFVPFPLPISGNTTVCSGDTLMLSDLIAGGVWASSMPGIATVGAVSGIVTGIGAGAATITYTLPAAGCMVTRPVTIFAPPCPTGLSSIINNNTVEIFPNPADDKLTIQTNGHYYNTLTITNTTGQVMAKQQLNSALTKVSIKSFPCGMYYITLKGESGSIVRKFVKE